MLWLYFGVARVMIIWLARIVSYGGGGGRQMRLVGAWCGCFNAAPCALCWNKTSNVGYCRQLPYLS